MKRFSFQLPTRIEFGNGVSGNVGEEAKSLGGYRALIVTDPGVEAAGLVDPVTACLEEAGVQTVLFDAVAPNPRDATVQQGAEILESEGCDVLVAVGGGSPMDTAKAIGVVATHGGRIQDYEGLGLVQKPITPLIAIPTTSGTGSEVTFWAVITDTERSFKMSVGSSLCAATVALVDPELTLGLPAAITAYTGVDALTHAVEGFTSVPSEPLTDSLAVSAIRLIASSLRRAYADGTNTEARYAMSLASLLAGVAFGNSDIAAVHCMGEAIGGLYDTPHGIAMAIYLPVVSAFNCDAVPKKYAIVAEALGEDVSGLSELDAARCASVAIRRLTDDLDIPSASEAGVRRGDFPRLAKAASVNVSVESNPRESTEADFMDLFEAAQAVGERD
jgi:alcohol dehydrogenase